MSKQSNNKSKFNLCIDIIMLLLLLPTFGIGLLTKYILIPGSERALVYGPNTDLLFWGLDRHQWGTIHMIISLVFGILLVLHIILHWKLILCIFEKMLSNRPTRILVALVILIGGLAMIAFPIVVKPDVVYREALHRNRQSTAGNPLSSGPAHTLEPATVSPVTEPAGADTIHRHSGEEGQALKDQYEVYGSQSLQSIAERFELGSGDLARVLGVPESQAGERAGRLGKRYGFTMTDVRNSIKQLKQKDEYKK